MIKKMKRIFVCLAAAIGMSALVSCGTPEPDVFREKVKDTTPELSWNDMIWQEEMKLSYATQFKVESCGAYRLLTIVDSDCFLVVPWGEELPCDIPKNVYILQQPLDHIYLVASSAMDFFCELEGVSNIKLSGIKESGWYLDEAKDAMERGEILYAGKYSAPDYELILEKECDLAIQSTMIYHNPEVQENLEGFGIPVLVEHSSYESHPLGRMEWIKLYGVLLGKEEEAAELYDSWLEELEPVLNQENTGKTVAFFYITSNGAVNVRKTNDYIAKMISLAGGNYIFTNLENEEENALSTMNIQMEEFYAVAKDADYLIYNSTIDGELSSVEELLAKSGVLEDFKAVKDGHVYCAGKNFFQETTGMGTFIQELNGILLEESGDGQYLYRLR